MTDSVRPSPLALAVLGLLYGGPLHPYRMQRLLKEWGKDQVINIGQRSSLYKTITRLHDAGLIAVRHTEREQRYPERTVYELTEDGRRAALAWVDDMLSRPRNEFPRFPAALSFAMLLGPPGALAALQRRRKVLRESRAALEDELARFAPALPRVTLLEVEYQLALTTAEMTWVNGVVDDLKDGSLRWTREDFASAAEAYVLDDARRAETP